MVLGAGIAAALPRARAGRARDGDELAERAREGLVARLEGRPDPRYGARLAHELAAIERGGDARFFLFLQDVVQTLEARGLVLGPGRGIAPSSVVLWALDVTRIDPLAHELVFERFYRPGRPWVDLDASALDEARIAALARSWFGHDRVDHEVEPDAVTLRCESSELRVFRMPALSMLRGRPRAAPRGKPVLPAPLVASLAKDRFPELFDGRLAEVARSGPRTFDELAASYALDGPDYMGGGLASIYRERRSGYALWNAPPIDDLLCSTRGLFLYQEQVILVMHELAGMDLVRADQVRRALMKKDREAIQQAARALIAGARARGYGPIAPRLAADLLRHARYAFSRAHVASYATLLIELVEASA